MSSTSTESIFLAGMLLSSFGLALAIGWTIAVPSSGPRLRWKIYEDRIEAQFRFLMKDPGTGTRIARAQLIFGLITLGLGASVGNVSLILLAILCAVGPTVYLQSALAKRRDFIEKQLEPWLLFLANNLRAAPSIGESLSATARLVTPPLSEELDLVVKEIQLGSPIDQALTTMGDRVGSSVLHNALAILIIGRNTGGDLPRVLESSANSLREMMRLDAMVKAKTSEARAQTIFLGIVPIGMALGVWKMKPDFFAPLFADSTGIFIIGIAVVMWIAAILIARVVMNPDL